MNRIIKFRLYSKSLHIMWTPDKAIQYGKNLYTIPQMMDGILKIDDDEEVMQFTGLTDTNGKDIYEGDIVSYHDFYEGDYKEKGGIGFIQWDEEHHYVARWGVDEQYICSTWNLAKNYGGQVIGNIFENHELLEK